MHKILTVEQFRAILLNPRMYEASRLGAPSIDNLYTVGLEQAIVLGFLEEKDLIGHLRNWHFESYLDALWGLVNEGVLRPGKDASNPSFPFINPTEYGKACIRQGTPLPHDPEGYCHSLQESCPLIDATTIVYLREALSTFRKFHFLASAVMIGVAAESVLLQLGEYVYRALDSENKQTKFRDRTRKRPIKELHDEIRKWLTSPSVPLPEGLRHNVGIHVDGMFDFIRKTRNEAGHPTGRELQKNEVNALLLMFPIYAKTANELMAWLKGHNI